MYTANTIYPVGFFGPDNGFTSQNVTQQFHFTVVRVYVRVVYTSQQSQYTLRPIVFKRVVVIVVIVVNSSAVIARQNL